MRSEFVMSIRLFNIRFNASLNGFDESELQEFIKDKEIIRIKNS